jgi:SPP1 family holin
MILALNGTAVPRRKGEKAMEEEKKVIQPEGSGVEPATIARTVCLFIALVNQLLAVCGKGTIGIADDTVYQLATAGFTITAALISWWKNNSFTREAKASDKVMKQLKGK